GVAAAARGREQTVLDHAAQGSARRDVAHAEVGQQLDERGGGQGLGLAPPVVTQQGQQQARRGTLASARASRLLGARSRHPWLPPARTSSATILDTFYVARR